MKTLKQFLTETGIDDLRSQLSGMGLKDFYIMPERGSIHVANIVVPEDKRNSGLGSRAMKAITDHADKTGQRVTLRLAEKGYNGSKGPNSLRDFYKRFGFVDNKGRNKDFSISDHMYREPMKESLSKDRNEYKIDHEAPDPSFGSPMHDVTLNGTYPKDFYTGRAFQYAHEPYPEESISKIMSVRNQPDKTVQIYRAVPRPDGKTGQAPDVSNAHINPGDWVTPSKSYAIEHGRSALGGNFRICFSRKPAKELFTDGNSIHEWGWHPHVD